MLFLFYLLFWNIFNSVKEKQESTRIAIKKTHFLSNLKTRKQYFCQSIFKSEKQSNIRSFISIGPSRVHFLSNNKEEERKLYFKKKIYFKNNTETLSSAICSLLGNPKNFLSKRVNHQNCIIFVIKHEIESICLIKKIIRPSI